MSPAPPPLSDSTYRGGVVLAVVVAAALAFSSLGARSYSVDEVGSLVMAGDVAAALGDSNMLLYYTVLRVWTVLGDGEWIVRSLSVLFALAALPFVAAVGRRLFDARTGVIAALLLATNVFFLRYARDARSYSLFLLLAVVSTLLFLRAREKGSWRRWVTYAGVTALAVYAHFFAALLVPVHAVAVRRQSAVRFVAAVVAVGLLAVPIVLATPLDASQVAWIQEPPARELLGLAKRFAGSRPLLVLLGACAAWAVVTARRPGAARFRLGATVFCAAWAALPVLLAFAASHLLRPLFADRYLILCLPGLVILAAAGIASLRWTVLQDWLVVFVLAGSFAALPRSRPSGEDWRAAALHVLGAAEAGDTVVCPSLGGERAFTHYLRRLRTDGPAPGLLGPDRATPAEVLARPGRIWLVEREGGAAAAGSSARLRALSEALGARRAALDGTDVSRVRLLLFDAPGDH